MSERTSSSGVIVHIGHVVGHHAKGRLTGAAILLKLENLR